MDRIQPNRRLPLERRNDMQITHELIQGLSDSQVVDVTKELFNNVYTQVPYDEVRSNSEGVAEVKRLLSLNTESLKQEMSAAESARFGRLLLEEYASDPDLEPFVQQALEKVQSSDDLIVGELLALGIIVNLTLLVATTSVKVKKDADGNITWEVIKKTTGPKLIEAILTPLASLAKVGIA